MSSATTLSKEDIKKLMTPKNPSKGALLTKKLAKMFGRTVKAIQNQQHKKPENFIRNQHYTYVQPNPKENTKLTSWEPEGSLELLFHLKETYEIKIWRQWLIQLGKKELERQNFAYEEIYQEQKTLFEGDIERKNLIQAQHVSKCRCCGRIITEENSIEHGKGSLCRTGKCTCKSA